MSASLPLPFDYPFLMTMNYPLVFKRLSHFSIYFGGTHMAYYIVLLTNMHKNAQTCTNTQTNLHRLLYILCNSQTTKTSSLVMFTFTILYSIVDRVSTRVYPNPKLRVFEANFETQTPGFSGLNLGHLNVFFIAFPPNLYQKFHKMSILDK